MADAQTRQISGWLALLSLILLAAAPALTAIVAITTIVHLKPNPQSIESFEAWGALKNVVWTFFIVKSALWISAGYKLRNSFVPSSPRYAVAALWIAGPALSLAQSYVIGVIANVRGSSAVAASEITPLLLSVAWATVWTAYLVRSRQVRAMYYGTPSTD